MKILFRVIVGLVSLILSVSVVLALVVGNTSGASNMAYAIAVTLVGILSIFTGWLAIKK